MTCTKGVAIFCSWGETITHSTPYSGGSRGEEILLQSLGAGDSRGGDAGGESILALPKIRIFKGIREWVEPKPISCSENFIDTEPGRQALSPLSDLLKTTIQGEKSMYEVVVIERFDEVEEIDMGDFDLDFPWVGDIIEGPDWGDGFRILEIPQIDHEAMTAKIIGEWV